MGNSVVFKNVLTSAWKPIKMPLFQPAVILLMSWPYRRFTSPLRVFHLLSLERTPPLPPPPLLSLINQSEIPWLTAVPDGIITPRFHSQLAQDPPPAEVAVPPPSPHININTTIWQRYVILDLWGDMLRWSPNNFSFVLFIFVAVQFHKSWIQDALCFVCTYRNLLEMTQFQFWVDLVEIKKFKAPDEQNMMHCVTVSLSLLLLHVPGTNLHLYP